MKLREAVEGYLKGGPKGIRRSRWPEGTWVKLNDHQVRDDIAFVCADGEKRWTGYTPNIVDLCANDWEVVS